jgi:hypothetical protein
MQRKGIGAVGAVVILVFGLLLGAGGYYLFFVNQNASTTTTTETIQSVSTTTAVVGGTQTVTQSVTMTATTTLPITFTDTITATATQTSSSVSTTTSSYPMPTNVTLVFTNVVGQYLFVVQAGNTVTSGQESGDYSVKLTGLSQGELVSITGTTQGVGGCHTGEQFTMALWLNGQMVASTFGYCSGGSAYITYRV